MRNQKLRVESDPHRAGLWIAAGNIFSLVFNRPPDDSICASHITASILYDPLAEASYEKIFQSPRDISDLESYQSLYPFLRSGVLSPPLNNLLKERFFSVAGECIPEDFKKLMNYMNGATFADWRITGLPLNEVAMEKSNLFTLAESSSGNILCAMDGDASSAVYFVDIEDASIHTIGDNFDQAWKTVSKQPRP